MATITQQLDIQAGKLRTASFPALVQANGSNYPVPGYAFDAASEEQVYFQFVATDYGSGNLTLKILWYADTATSGVVRWGTQLAVITPNTDTQDIETDGLAAENATNDTHLGTTGQRLHQLDHTISTLDSLAADDFVTLKLYRDVTDSADTMAGDAIIVGLILEYSDT